MVNNRLGDWARRRRKCSFHLQHRACKLDTPSMYTWLTNQAQGLNHSNQLYISATSAASVTISGSPSLRSQMFDAPTFKDLQHRDIPIRGPYHASHLYSLSDVDKIINHDIACELQKYPVIHSLVGDTSKPASSLELFRRSVLDILTQEVQWDASVKACVTNVRSSAVTGLRILPMGPTALSNSLVSAFKVGGGLQISLVDGVSWFAHNTMPRSLNGDLKNAKIAIVGMAGRFPNAADHDAFWKLLEQGLDVHREAGFACNLQLALKLLTSGLGPFQQVRCQSSLRPHWKRQKHESHSVWMFY